MLRSPNRSPSRGRRRPTRQPERRHRGADAEQRDVERRHPRLVERDEADEERGDEQPEGPQRREHPDAPPARPAGWRQITRASPRTTATAPASSP